MSELTAEEKKQADETIKEVCKETIAKDEEKQEAPRPDIVLSVSMSADGVLKWSIPNDMIMTAYLLKHLDIMVSQRHKKHIEETLRSAIQKPNIITSLRTNPIMKRVLG